MQRLTRGPGEASLVVSGRAEVSAWLIPRPAHVIKFESNCKHERERERERERDTKSEIVRERERY